MAYAAGKKAWGISDRSGRRYRLNKMKTEWTGAKVGPDEFDPKQPQLFPPKAFPDPQALRDPRPETGLAEQRAIQTGWNPVGFAAIAGLSPPNNLVAVGSVGTAVVSTSDEDVVSGVSATGSVGVVTVSLTSTAPRFDSTAITLDSTTDTFDEG